MQILNKKYRHEIALGLDVAQIEQFIHDTGYIPLRWAIVEVKDNFAIIDAVVISK